MTRSHSVAHARTPESGPMTVDTRAPGGLPPFPEIYNQYFSFVWSSARRLGVRPEAMDDVVQESFIVIHARLGTLEHPDSLRSWIYSIVRRTASTHHRARHVREGTGLAERLAREALYFRQATPLDHALQA